MRRIAAAALAGLTALALVLAAAAAWTSGTALDTGRFVAQVGPIIDQQPVRDALSTQVGAQLSTVLGVPAARAVIERETAAVVASPAFRPLWYSALGAAHHEVVLVLTSPDPSVRTVGGDVYIDLIGVVAQVLHQLPPAVTTLLGARGQLQLPTNATPTQLRALVSHFLGAPLPAGFASFPITRTSTLNLGRKSVGILDGAAPVLLFAAAVLLGMALALSRRRLLTLGLVGLLLAVFTAVAYVIALGVGTAVPAGLSNGAARPVVTSAVQALLASLRTPAFLLGAGGAAVAVVCWLLPHGAAPLTPRRS